MADTTAVQGAQQAAATKTKEITEAFIRALLQQSRDSAKDRNVPIDNTAKPEAIESLFRSFYQKYKENGVDDATARTAAADAALGIGASDSPAVKSAEQQVLANAQSLAKDYQVNAAIAQDKSLPMAERKEALDRIDDIEAALDIKGKSRDEKTEVLSGLLHQQPEQTTAAPATANSQSEPTQSTAPQPPARNQLASNNQPATETLRQTAQENFERAGAKPETARKASYEFATEGGAKPGPHIKRAHQEIEQHNVLKNMYQSVYEQHGVSPDVAEKAADQLARGNGANRSTAVERAHDQALANISQKQQASRAPVQKTAAEKDSANRSHEDRQVRPKVGDHAQQSPATQSTTPKSRTKPEQTAAPKPRSVVETGEQQSTEASTQATQTPPAQEAPDPLWQQHSPTEQGARGANQFDYHKDPKVCDKRFSYNARSAGASKEAVKASILLNSPAAKTSINPERYAKGVIRETERLLPLTDSQSPSQSQMTTTGTTQLEQSSPALATQSKPNKSAELPSKAAIATSTNPQPAAETKQAVANAGATKPQLTPEQIYNKYDNGKSTGVFQSVMKSNPQLRRENDLSIAKQAFLDSHPLEDITAGIAQNSSHAQGLDQKSNGHMSYAKRTVAKAQKELGKDADSSDTKSEKAKANDQSKDKQVSKSARNKKQSSQSKAPKKAPKRSKQRTKAKSRGQGMEI